MPEIKPFKGIMYNQEKIRDLSTVICQPYDQVSNKMEREYKNRSPYNFIRLVLTKYSEGHNRQREYRDARRYTETWTQEQIFINDMEEAIYPYWQEFTIQKTKYTRKGFICLVRLEELGKGDILPHEKTLSKPKADRLNLLNITKKDFEPVFLLYTDPKKTVNTMLAGHCEENPLIETKDEMNITHKLWRVSDKETIDKVIKKLAKSIFVIADGHHRYETAFNYKNELSDIDENHPANFKMIALVNIEDPGLVILPTHRLVKNIEEFSLIDFLKKTEQYFSIKKTDKDSMEDDLKATQGGSFGFYSPQTAYILTLKDKTIMNKHLADRSEDYQNLDVAILHTLLIEDVLAIEPEHIEDHIRYERDIKDAMRRVDAGAFHFCFIMNPTRSEQVKKVAQNKERMPQKSTDFYPKLISGLVFYDVAGE
jgi:uncharacterized protein (DUF1015 family)